MSYSTQANSTTPACIVFLLDQSLSMKEMWASDSTKSKAEQVADVINRFLFDLTLRCSKGEEIKNRVHIGIIGYGGLKSSVKSAFQGSLIGKEIIPIEEVAKSPIRVEKRSKKESDGAGGVIVLDSPLPIWIEPIANGGTPMKEAFDLASQMISKWVMQYPESFPPIVVNITDAESDSDPSDSVNTLANVQTSDGNALILNIQISSSNHVASLYPSSESEVLDLDGKKLFLLSSILPDNMFNRAKELYPNLKQGARGFSYNADLYSLVNFLDIGSTAVGR